MTTTVDSGIGPGTWAVLGVLAEAPAHGFGVARRHEPEAAIGQVWTMSRTRVYRAINELAERQQALAAATAFEAVVLRDRVEAARAALVFVEECLAAV